MTLDIIYVIGGLILLFGGAEFLIRSCVRLSLAFRIPPLVIALTVIAFATSLPEGVTSSIAQIKDISDIAIGNVVGSNIANIGLVLAIALLISPTSFAPALKNKEIPLVFVLSLLLWGVMALGPIGWVKGLLFFLLLIAYIAYQFTQKHDVKIEEKKGKTSSSLVLLIIGIACLVIGAEGLISGGTALAKRFGASNRVLSITLIAIGTSLPELATAIVASLRRHSDVVMGNIFGSNIFNTLFIVGLASLFRPIEFSPKMLHIDALVMCGFSLLILLLARMKKPGRFAGGLLLALYMGYLSSLI